VPFLTRGQGPAPSLPGTLPPGRLLGSIVGPDRTRRADAMHHVWGGTALVLVAAFCRETWRQATSDGEGWTPRASDRHGALGGAECLDREEAVRVDAFPNLPRSCAWGGSAPPTMDLPDR
jgi:hypothetical protein